MTKIQFHRERQSSYFVISGKAMREIYDSLDLYARFADTILLMGETGVGKDMIARELHRISPRRDKPFISVPLASLSPTLFESELFGHEKGAFTGADQKKIGIFEAANGGVLYFPEISELPEQLQLKLLDFLQYRTLRRVGHNPKDPEINMEVCMIFASNEDLELCMHQEKLRKDFYYRINKHCINIPPLRIRRDEIGPLADHFSYVHGKRLLGKQVKLSQQTIDTLKQYHWPGNVRELEGVIEKAIVNFGKLSNSKDYNELLEPALLKDFPSYRNRDSLNMFHEVFSSMNTIPDNNTVLRKCEKAYLSELMRRAGGNLIESARIAKFSVKTLRRKLRKFEIVGKQ
jgi:two-component system, NtrC family, response regulator HydG